MEKTLLKEDYKKRDNRSLYKNIFILAMPIALQNLISFITNIVDTLMLGKLENAEVLIAGSTLADQPLFILAMICFGFSGGVLALCSQYWGKKDVVSIRKIMSIALKCVVAIALLIQTAVLLFPTGIMGIYSNNAQVVTAGVDYLRIFGFGYVLYAFSSMVLCSIRSVEIVKTAVLINVSTLVINVFLNWVFIFGKLGVPAMGLKGSALATLIARAVEFVLVCLFIFTVDKKLNFRLKDLLLFDKILAGDLLKIGTPVVLNELFWALGISVQAAILGNISYSFGEPVAANTIANNIQQLATIVIFGIANAAAVIVGKAIGEGDLKEAAHRAKVLKIMSMGVGVLGCGLVLVLRHFVIDFFDVSSQTKELTFQLMTVTAFVVFFISIAAMSIVGILRGGGDTKFCLICEMIVLWLVAVPFAYLAAVVFKWPVFVVLICMKVDEPIKSVACLVRIHGSKWIHSVTRDFTGVVQ